LDQNLLLNQLQENEKTQFFLLKSEK